MIPLSFYKVTSLPANPAPNAIYYVKDISGVRQWVTDEAGVAQPVIDDGLPITTDWVRTITVESPTGVENIAFFYTDVALTLTKLYAVLVGSSSPSVTWTIKFAMARNLAGTEVIIGGHTTTSTTSGDVITSFDNGVIPANRVIWLETTASSGIVDEMSITMIYKTN